VCRTLVVKDTIHLQKCKLGYLCNYRFMQLSLSQKLAKIEEVVGVKALKGYSRTCIVGGRQGAGICAKIIM